MPEWLTANYFVQNLFWGVIQQGVVSIIVATLGVGVANKAFSLLKSKAQQLWFFLFVGLATFVLTTNSSIGFGVKPDFQVTVYTATFPSSPTGNPQGTPTAIILAGVTNIGNMPSVVDNFQFDISLNGTVYHGRATAISSQVTIKMPDSPKQQSYTQKQSLAEVTSTVIGIGSRKVGILLYQFPDMRVDELSGENWVGTLYATDVLNRTTKGVFTPGPVLKDFPVVPGMGQD